MTAWAMVVSGYMGFGREGLLDIGLLLTSRVMITIALKTLVASICEKINSVAEDSSFDIYKKGKGKDLNKKQ